MINKLNITAKTHRVWDSVCSYIESDDGNLLAICLGENKEQNSCLYAEAGTVLNETGLTPRQLLEQRDELLAALECLQASIYISSESEPHRKHGLLVLGNYGYDESGAETYQAFSENRADSVIVKVKGQ